MQDRTTFDITDGRNRYRPCPRCERTFGMGLVTRRGKVAVWCECEFTGPPAETDREAFDAWNALPRDVMLTDRYTGWCWQEANRAR
jgi:hypothetical protein